MNLLGKALLAYNSGNTDAFFTIVRDDGFEQRVPINVFFEAHKFPELEARALDVCAGTVLDVGAAAGRHSLELLRRGMAVWSLDILPETKQIITQRGVPRPIVGDVMYWAGRSFDRFPKRGSSPILREGWIQAGLENCLCSQTCTG